MRKEVGIGRVFGALVATKTMAGSGMGGIKKTVRNVESSFGAKLRGTSVGSGKGGDRKGKRERGTLYRVPG